MCTPKIPSVPWSMPKWSETHYKNICYALPWLYSSLPLFFSFFYSVVVLFSVSSNIFQKSIPIPCFTHSLNIFCCDFIQHSLYSFIKTYKQQQLKQQHQHFVHSIWYTFTMMEKLMFFYFFAKSNEKTRKHASKHAQTILLSHEISFSLHKNDTCMHACKYDVLYLCFYSIHLIMGGWMNVFIFVFALFSMQLTSFKRTSLIKWHGN